MGKFKNTEKFDRYRIKGKTYYKVQSLPVNEDDRDIVSEIWIMKNVEDENFKLFIRHQRKNTVYSMYSDNGPCLFKTYSITKVV